MPIAVITGTTHGIGLVTSRELARAGFDVVMLCRNSSAADAWSAQLRRQFPDVHAPVVPCDLAALGSVHAAAQQVRRQFGPIDVLINNAGLVSARQRFSADGVELTFAVNHLGPFLLTGMLQSHMSPHGRIVTVASRAHFQGLLTLDDLAAPAARYRAVAAYARSKLANVLHTFALARRLQGGVTANCLHPGVVATHLLPAWLRLLKPLVTPVTFDVERGAQTTLYLALSPEVAGINGRYFDENQLIQPASAVANDEQAQELLWEFSLRLIRGKRIDFTTP